MPPCPGKKDPVSLIFALLFKNEINKSPICEMKETIKVVNNHIKDVDSRVRTDLESVLNKELEQIDLKIVKQFDQIENDLRDIRNLLTLIDNSKIGKKIFQ